MTDFSPIYISVAQGKHDKINFHMTFPTLVPNVCFVPLMRILFSSRKADTRQNSGTRVDLPFLPLACDTIGISGILPKISVFNGYYSVWTPHTFGSKFAFSHPLFSHFSAIFYFFIFSILAFSHYLYLYSSNSVAFVFFFASFYFVILPSDYLW